MSDVSITSFMGTSYANSAQSSYVYKREEEREKVRDLIETLEQADGNFQGVERMAIQPRTPVGLHT